MDIEFTKLTDYNRGIMYEILKDAYSFDERYAVCWEENWKESDAFFFDNPDIAEKYGFVTCYKGEPIGMICWDPRNRPEYVEIGHNGIRTAYKGKGFGKAQLREAIRRIKEYEGLKEIRVCTNSNLIALKNYESAGFVLYDTKENKGEAAFSGDYLYYRIRLISGILRGGIGMFRKIDIENWNRIPHYEVYRQFANARYDITLELDVTNLVRFVKENQLSFTLTAIHTISKCANEIDEFRMRIENNEPVICDDIRLSFTYLNKQTNLMKNVVADNDEDVYEFNRSAREVIEKQEVYFTGPLGNGIYQFSSIPWISYTHVSHTFSGNKDYAVPVFDFGKFYEKNGRLVMPFSVEVHHAFVDGYHIGLLVEKLQRALDALSS